MKKIKSKEIRKWWGMLVWRKKTRQGRDRKKRWTSEKDKGMRNEMWTDLTGCG